jgi:prepilin-type N-terminal cleavage/methylation domain-containing protein
MIMRRGFTLLEVLVAIAVAGVVALLVYGTAIAGRDVEARLHERRRAVQTAQAFRSTVVDALRNARPSRQFGDTAFWIDVQRDGRGRPMDRLSFVTAGSLPPFTADADWQVTIEPRTDGITISAAPIGISLPARVVARYPGATGLEIRVLRPGSASEWAERWRFPALVPAAIELVYWDDRGPMGQSLRLTLPLGGSTL